VDEQLRSIHPPRGLVVGRSSSSSSGSSAAAGGALAALPRQNKEKSKRPALAFDTLMQWETRTEVDERLSAGGVHTAGGKDSASGRADFLLFHWRQQAREGHAEVVRLNAELETASKSWAGKESQLMALLHMEEQKVALLSAQNQSGQVEINALKQALDESRLASAEAAVEAEARDKRAAKEAEVSRLLVARLEEQVRKLQDELLQTASEKSAGASECAKLRRDMSESARLRSRAEAELATAQRVRDELLEKLESEEKFARNLAQQLDLMADFDAFEDMRHLMNKAAGLARNEGNRLKEMEALRAQVVRYTKDKGWQEKKASITRQARAIKKSHAAAAAAAAAGGGSGSGGGAAALAAAAAHQDPIPERRATDVIYERALNRMAH
jgi:chromosome segregation ATPase